MGLIPDEALKSFQRAEGNQARMSADGRESYGIEQKFADCGELRVCDILYKLYS